MPRRRDSVAPQSPEAVLVGGLTGMSSRIARMEAAGPSALQANDWEKALTPIPWEIIVNWPGVHRPAMEWDTIVYYFPGDTETVAGWKRIDNGAFFHAKVTADPFRYPPPQVGDGEFGYHIPEDVDLMTLYRVEMGLTTLGSSLTQVQLRNSRTGDMLSTRIQVDAGDYHSDDASTAYVIDPANAEVQFKDRIYIDVDAAASDSRGLTVYTYYR